MAPAAERLGGAAGYSVRVVGHRAQRQGARAVVRHIQLWHDDSMRKLFEADVHLLDAALESVHALGLEAKDHAHLMALVEKAHKLRYLK